LTVNYLPPLRKDADPELVLPLGQVPVMPALECLQPHQPSGHQGPYKKTENRKGFRSL
jgi:hypothetical protein